jgi:TPR repeat protein
VQVLVGMCHESGSGVEQSYLEAAMWFRTAADLNDPRAMVRAASRRAVGSLRRECNSISV